LERFMAEGLEEVIESIGEQAESDIASVACQAELKASGGEPERVLLLPRGKVQTRPDDTRESWTLDDPETVIAATRELRHERSRFRQRAEPGQECCRRKLVCECP
jgi:hypothetical protein